MCEVTRESYERYWDERNGGNVSVCVLPEEVAGYEDNQTVIRSFDLGFDAPSLSGFYYLVTGTGRYFRNILHQPELDLGLVQISEDGQSAHLLWGFADGGKPTSEFPSHLMSHMERLKVNPEQRVVFHCHPTNLIALTFTQDLDERHLSRLLWKMQAESLVVFPEGIGVIPYMTPGTREIGQATAEKMSEFQAVIWPHHGLFASGVSLDETYGLVEVIEKAAMIYSQIGAQGGSIKQDITDQQLVALAHAFGVTPHSGFLEEM
ncbi:rhamnulose-1-phosphate aldolase [Streptococcus cuniculi]|uniref:Rhamnulose-1-phosphate aldolase n=1 Tax=Streptococcus cuniculi TaxID=1432788 RepID=A0A4Y9JDM3_9STRE|nr:rhamnulose-1-phosphate aldolase [Streptococcus cuniculi]TFU98631.1 rhamnulose-1-phosphate aldolase [Streptococcus cuniculi]